MIFDLSNPRTVEDKIAELNKIKLVNIDQISEIVEKNVRKRKKEIQFAEKIIEEEIFLIEETLKRKSSEPLIITIFKDADNIREKEFKKSTVINWSQNGGKRYENFGAILICISRRITCHADEHFKKRIFSK